MEKWKVLCIEKKVQTDFGGHGTQNEYNGNMACMVKEYLITVWVLYMGYSFGKLYGVLCVGHYKWP